MRHETLAPLPMPLLSLKVVTPERIVYEADIDSISVMTEQGEITVLPNHVPLTTVLMPGEMRLKINGAETYLAVSTGFLQVRPGNEIVVLADTAERAEELELEKIEQARERASVRETPRGRCRLCFRRRRARTRVCPREGCPPPPCARKKSDVIPPHSFSYARLPSLVHSAVLV